MQRSLRYWLTSVNWWFSFGLKWVLTSKSKQYSFFKFRNILDLRNDLNDYNFILFSFVFDIWKNNAWANFTSSNIYNICNIIFYYARYYWWEFARIFIVDSICKARSLVFKLWNFWKSIFMNSINLRNKKPIFWLTRNYC